MTRIATSWLVYRLTDSAALLGIVSFAGQIPMFFLGPIAGVWVDRWDRHRTLVVTQVLSMLQSFGLAVLALTHLINIWEILLLSLMQGLINTFDMPSRQAFVVQMVENRDDLSNAIALNSSMVNASRLVGPAVAGVVIAAWGEGFCFLFDGISFLAVIGSLLAMKITAEPPRATQRNVWRELHEGWRYVVDSVAIRSILLLLALVSLLGFPYSVLMPIFASDVLGGGPHTLGFLMAASGVGALVGAILLAMRKSVLGLGRYIAICAALFGASLIGFSLSRMLWLSLILMATTGYGFMQQMASSNTVLQTIVQDEKRGRVMAFYGMAFLGMAPFGSLLAGGLAARIGAPATLFWCGVVVVISSLWFMRQLPAIRAEVRPLYIKLGILPEMALAVQQASAMQTPPED